ncbi:hypothetical protein [Streptomyces sp. NRRL S-920]|uniref:hypothetical protein n=1 Tax=Streptomyces sp. NRRL S-920 TaxID=1463921 RepID=UPI0004CA8572|nr:hypothetical protein [Streptomyces sp. NRRL S-920]
MNPPQDIIPPADGTRIELGATGHAGYKPGALTEVKLSSSYDEGGTWKAATTAEHAGTRGATVNHAGASGEQRWRKPG